MDASFPLGKYCLQRLALKKGERRAITVDQSQAEMRD